MINHDSPVSRVSASRFHRGSLVDSLSIISHPLSLVKRFFKTFLKNFSPHSLPRRFPQGLCDYTTSSPFCQPLSLIFFHFFPPLFLKAGPSVNFALRNNVYRDFRRHCTSSPARPPGRSTVFTNPAPESAPRTPDSSYSESRLGLAQTRQRPTA